MIVTLLRHYSHAGVLHKPGDRIILPDAAASWLIDSGMARAARQDPKPTRAPRKE